MAVSFALESRPNKAGEFPIRVSVSIHQVRMQTTSGYCISKDKWVDALTDKDRKNRDIFPNFAYRKIQKKPYISYAIH